VFAIFIVSKHLAAHTRRQNKNRFFLFLSAAEHLNILGKVIYPLSHLSFQVNGRRKALLDIHPLFTFNQVVSVAHDLLFGRFRHAVTGRQPKYRAFISRKSCTGMALNNTGNLLVDPDLTQVICSLLSMQDRVTRPSPDIMKHRTFYNKPDGNKGIALSVFKRHIPNSPAMRNHFFAAPCFAQQIFRVFIRSVRHDPVTF
jgi:hypothetical protein